MLRERFRDSGTAMIYDCTQEMSTAPLCKRRKVARSGCKFPAAKPSAVSLNSAEELHPPDGMGPRHGDEAREKEQHA
jgi:hypothetical protein